MSSYFLCLCHSCSIPFSDENIPCAHIKWYFVSLCINLQRQTAGYNVVVHGRPNKKKVSSVKCEQFANQTSFLNWLLDGGSRWMVLKFIVCHLRLVVPSFCLNIFLVSYWPIRVQFSNILGCIYRIRHGDLWLYFYQIYQVSRHWLFVLWFSFFSLSISRGCSVLWIFFFFLVLDFSEFWSCFARF